MQSSYFTEDHEKFRKTVHSYLDREVISHLDQWEYDKRIPRSIWEQMGDLGLLGLHYPKTSGGLEKDFFYSVVLLEELGRTGYAGFRVAIAVHAYMATSYIAQFGSDELKQKYLSPAISGKKISCLAITEAHAGSDLNQLKTTAVIADSHFVINGNKKFVANGSTADFVVVAVKTSPSTANIKRGTTGVSLIVVDTNSAGLSTNKLDNLGWHCSDTVELIFKDVRVPVKNMIGTSNLGFYYIMRCLQIERLAAGILAIGGMDRCLDLTWRYLSTRKVFDGTLSKLQSIRHRMADLVTDVAATRQLAYHAAWLFQNSNQLPIAACSMVKLKATELANRVAQECMQFHGASGYQNESAISRMYRDSQAASIAGGASEIMRDIISQQVFEESGG